MFVPDSRCVATVPGVTVIADALFVCLCGVSTMDYHSSPLFPQISRFGDSTTASLHVIEAVLAWQ